MADEAVVSSGSTNRRRATAENSAGGNRVVHFEGNQLLVDKLLLVGERRVSVTFRLRNNTVQNQ
jgi:hypothetical protein